MIVGHTLNESGGPNFFSPAREMWTDADVSAESAKGSTPVPPGVLEALRSAYPNAKPVEIYPHTLGLGGLRDRIETVAQAARRAAQRAAPTYIYTFAWKLMYWRAGRERFIGVKSPSFSTTRIDARSKRVAPGWRLMAAKISDAWVAFARTGNPNHTGIPNWPEFSPERAPTMSLTTVTAQAAKEL